MRSCTLRFPLVASHRKIFQLIYVFYQLIDVIGKEGNAADGFQPVEMDGNFDNDNLSLGSLLSRANSKTDLFQNFRAFGKALPEDTISLNEEDLANISDINMSWRSQTPPMKPTATYTHLLELFYYFDRKQSI